MAINSNLNNDLPVLGPAQTPAEHGADLVGQTLAHFTLESRLGEGGSGVVYRARDLRLDRTVAVKILTDALRDDEMAWARLLREARLASHLNHPHIAAIHDLGEEDGRAYIVMEYVEGLALAEIIPDGGMPAAQVERYGRQLTEALGYAHAQGVIHGDLKGANIIVTHESAVKLLDFGLGRRIPRNGMMEVTSNCLPLAEAGATAGTLPYLAPEVLRGGPPSVQSDMWALGVVLYQMATGELPFYGATPFELSVEIMVGTPSKLGQLAEPLGSVLRRCLEKDPEARFQQAQELGNALEGDSSDKLSAEERGKVPVPPPATPALTAVARPRSPWWRAGASVALALVLAGGFHVWHGRPATTVAVAAPAATARTSRGEDPNAKVWVNTDSGTYHCAGSRWYGKTHVGEFMTQQQARAKGYHPAGKHACG